MTVPHQLTTKCSILKIIPKASPLLTVVFTAPARCQVFFFFFFGNLSSRVVHESSTSCIESLADLTEKISVKVPKVLDIRIVCQFFGVEELSTS